MTPTIGSLCTGIGGLDLGIERATGAATLWQCEIEPHLRDVLAARWPDAHQYHDVTTLIDEDPAPVDILCMGFPCFVAGTHVLTRDRGYRPIETLEVGDLVLTHRRRWRAVTSVMQRHDAPTRLVTAGGITVETTDEHPFWTIRQSWPWDNEKRRNVRTLGTPGWTDAAHLVTSAHRVANTTPDAIRPHSGAPEFWRLVGRYLADGWRVDGRTPLTGRVVICCAASEADELAALIRNADYRATRVDDRTVTKFHITNSSLYRWLRQFGRLAHGKTLPGWVLELPEHLADALLQGWLDGDGHQYPSDWRGTTVSRSLALGMAALAQRARGVVASVFTTPVRETTVIEGRTVNQRTQYQVAIPHRPKSTFVDPDGYGWRLVKKNEPSGRSATVWNISVEEDESYVADGMVVHNCQDISLAGRGAGLGGKRSGLWWDCARAVEHLRPTWVVVENVAALRGRGLDAVTDHLAALGYVGSWGTFRSGAARGKKLAEPHVGGCHERARLFVVARLEDVADAGRGGRAPWPRPGTGEPSELGGYGSRDHGRAATPEGGGSAPADTIGAGVGSDPRVRGADGRSGDREQTALAPGEDMVRAANVGPSDRRPHLGRYEQAVARWEHLSRPAPHPTTEGPRRARVLNQRFSEWMMGYPDGWATDAMPRRKALKAVGNSVQPQVAELAFRVLAERVLASVETPERCGETP